MAIQRKMTIKERAQWLWAKHKGKVLILTTILGIGIYLGVKNSSRESQQKEDGLTDLTEEMKRLYPDIEWEDLDKLHARVQRDLPGQELESEEKQTFEEKLADPDRRLGCGGWVLENDMGNKELPELIANDVPVSALGEFGQELIKLAEGKDLGDFNQDLENAWTSIIINLETPYVQEREENKEEAA